MIVNLSALAGAGEQFLDANGNPLTGGKLYSYEAGTTTPQITYTTAAGNVPHSNPIILDSAGRVPGGQIWLSAGLNYKFVLTSSTDTSIGAWDNITGINGTGIAANAINVQYDPAGSGAVPTTVQAKLRETVSVKDFGAVGDGVADDTVAIQAALDSGAGKVIAPDSTYKITATILIPNNVSFEGLGMTATNIVISADVVGVRLGSRAKFSGFRVTKTGTHTQNGVEIGSSTTSGARSVVDSVSVEGVGNDGIQVRDGNLGSIRDVICILNGRDGINFTTETGNNNAWKLEGFIDVRSNVRDGLHLTQGSSASDPSAPKSSSFDLIVAQQNGRHGVYVGTRSNNFVLYGEANGSVDVFLDTYAAGNNIIIVEGFVTDNGVFNVVSQHNANQLYRRSFTGKILFGGGAGNGLRIGNDDATPGVLDIEKVSARSYQFIASKSNANQTSVFTNTGYPTYRHDVIVQGNVTPDILLLKDGASYSSIKTQNNVTTGTLEIFKSGANTHYIQTAASSLGHNVYFDALGGGTTWNFKGTVIPSGDNLFSLGNASNRWSEVFAAAAAINTSDGREKQQIRTLSEKEHAVAVRVKGLIRAFKFNDAVEKKSDKARIHFGVVAQDIKAAFEAEGLVAEDYSLFCHDTFEDAYEDVFEEFDVLETLEDGTEVTVEQSRATGEKRLVHSAGDRYGIRYEELLAFVIAAL